MGTLISGNDLTLTQRGIVPGLAITRGPTGFYATRLLQAAPLALDESRAEELWRDVSRHRRALGNRLGRDVGQRVALLDFLANVQGEDERAQLAAPDDAMTLPQQAITDPLTGLFNQFFFELEVQREVERTVRYGTPCSLMLLDLDRFAALNERHGHAAGDEVLQAAAAVILHHVRVPDVACRVGADEFAILLPGTAQAQALLIARRICADVAEWFRQNRVGQLQLEVSASVGVASLSAGGGAEVLLGAARQALGDAKRLGGHRVIAPLVTAAR